MTTNSKKGVSVIICSYNGAKRLPVTLHHLARQQVPHGISWEIILIDNASSDRTSGVAQENWIKYGAPATLNILHEPLPGKGHAMKKGIETSKYEYLLICDDDNWLDMDYLGLAFTVMERHSEIGILGGHGVPVFETDPPVWFTQFQDKYGVGPQAPERGCLPPYKHYLYGAGSVIRKAAYRKIMTAGFPGLLVGPAGDRLTGGGEDAELCHAMKIAGYRLWYEDILQFSHFMPSYRLRWRYLLSLEKTTASLYVVSKAYKALLEGDLERCAGNSAVRTFLKRWFEMNLMEFMRLLFRRFSHPFLKLEGNRTDHLIIRRLVWIRMFLVQRHTMERNFRTVVQFANRMARMRRLPEQESGMCIRTP